MNNWELVDRIPPAHWSRSLLPSLKPGQIIRRQHEKSINIGNYKKRFAKEGLTDYRITTRTQEGTRYIYIWREPLENTT